MVSISHFSGWKDIFSFLFPNSNLFQNIMLIIWVFSIVWCYCEVRFCIVCNTLRKRVVVYRTVDLIPPGMSLMKNRNNVAPSTEPWDTPHCTSMCDELSPSMTSTAWVRYDRMLAIHLLTCFPICVWGDCDKPYQRLWKIHYEYICLLSCPHVLGKFSQLGFALS